LDAVTLQLFYNGQNATYAPATVRVTHAVLASALKRAVAWRLIPFNPADHVTLAAIHRPTPTVWTTEEAKSFLAFTGKHRFGGFWRLALDSGMRLGEILAVGWRDIDLEKRTISVHRTLTRDLNAQLKISEVPKTRSSRRQIKIGVATVAALRAQRV
jgi:integrase